MLWIKVLIKFKFLSTIPVALRFKLLVFVVTYFLLFKFQKNIQIKKEFTCDSFNINSCALAFLADSNISCSLISGFPICMFSLIVPQNKTGSWISLLNKYMKNLYIFTEKHFAKVFVKITQTCCTTPTIFLSHLMFISFISTLSIATRPLLTSSSLVIRPIEVDFPQPLNWN